MKRTIFIIPLLLSIMGIIDAGYLTYEHFAKVLPPCHLNRFLPILSDCGIVLQSKYSVIFGIPLALLGTISYIILASIILLAILSNKKIFRIWSLIHSAFSAAFSLYLMYLQIFVIKSICIYCTLSAIISFTLFILLLNWLENERKFIVINIHGFLYQQILKKILFLFDPEFVHVLMVQAGEILGKTPIKNVIDFLVVINHTSLAQSISGIMFRNPVGLSAGFDYNAQLTQILPHIGFGFMSVGTITHKPYEGNPKPMLGRLPKSQSLMVNKGFKNPGASNIIGKLDNMHFKIPVGISIGRTNTKKSISLSESISDVLKTFELFEKSNVNNSYYELNISCPNLYGDISFYPPKNLKQLLTSLSSLNIKKPVFVKMPIEKSNKEFLDMLEVIRDFKFVKGIIIGNLQKNRKDPRLDPDEVKKFKVGYFSGKPCEKRSNELIGLAYRTYKKRYIIIGCGGVFSAKDAYKKIKLGASLIQLITGMIYKGPTLIAHINMDLMHLLKKDGYKNIRDAIGTEV